MDLSPILLTVYNRPEHTRETIEALKVNTLASQSILYICSDGAKGTGDVEDVKKVREYIHTITGFKEVHIIEREKNFGLAQNILKGSTEILNKYGKIIMIEDDIVTSPYFLKYMNDGLDKYRNDPKVGSISGFNFPNKTMKIPEIYKQDIFFSVRPSSWGWATWKDKWNQVDWEVKDFDKFINNPQEQKEFNKGGEDLTGMLIAQKEGKINSWAVRWSYNFYKKNWLSVYPVLSFVDNHGHDNSGRHTKASDQKIFENTELNMNSDIKFPDEPFLDEEICRRFKKVYARNLKYYIRKIKYKLSTLVK